MGPWPVSIGVANQEAGWLIEEEGIEVAKQALALQLQKNDGPLLVMRDLKEDLPDFADWLGCAVEAIAPKIAGDLASLSYATGRRFTLVSGHQADHAYDTLIHEQHYRKEAPTFYQAVGVPCAVLRATPYTPAEGDVPWRVAYEQLFLRVLAHYAREPVIVRAFLDEEDPIPLLRERIGLETSLATEAAVVWAALGYDTPYLEQHLPAFYEELSSLDLIRTRSVISGRFPLIEGRAQAHVREEYIQLRQVKTLYGRTLRWGDDLTAAYAHRFFGSVRDIIDIGLLSCSRSDEHPVVIPPSYRPTDTVIRIQGSVAKEQASAWRDELRVLAGLARPLSVPLSGTVIFE